MATQLRAFVEISRPELGAEVTLSESDTRHALSSLRLSLGDTLTVIDKTSGRSFEGEIVGSSIRAIVRLTKEISQRPSPSKLGGIIFGISKGEKNDLVVEKATEIGADNIILFQSAHSVVRIEDAISAKKKIDRWSKIAQAAAQQSKRLSVPKIILALNDNELLSAINHHAAAKNLKLLCSLIPEAVSITNNKITESTWVAVGPEGDFSSAEQSLLTANGFKPVTLGGNTLRAETAAIVAMGVVINSL
jgi:16S rRNA (uracil1498-N3)-methyltransferase